jgi:hypothetical protein
MFSNSDAKVRKKIELAKLFRDFFSIFNVYLPITLLVLNKFSRFNHFKCYLICSFSSQAMYSFRFISAGSRL